MRLALALLIAASGCAAENVPAPQSETGHGMKRVTQDVSPPSYGRPRPVLRDRASRYKQRPPLRAPVDSANAERWSRLVRCESGGDWQANTGNGYYGGVQMDLTFWRNYGGLRFAARPDLASRAEQITVAERGLAVQGWGSWPSCSRMVGLR